MFEVGASRQSGWKVVMLEFSCKHELPKEGGKDNVSTLRAHENFEKKQESDQKFS